ncbi:MAG: hypothetical protein UR98_C0003G0061 [Parcubacteria group bacterium GW2011_GWA1_36_12]|nr:MAG: hypothetical protein UR98_C0003G0061 [Parcubacteria group bacterium GW2011_GWA1_36_12]
MNRYQVYIKPKTINILDDVAKIIKVSRSQIIRDVTDRAAKEFEKILVRNQQTKMQNNPLIKMAGFAKSTTKNVSQNIREIYLAD